MSLTESERRAIRILRQAAECWPNSLWLFSGSGQLCVMKKVDGERALTKDGGMDSEAVVETIDIENDGGDW